MADKLPEYWWETIDRKGCHAGHLRLKMLAEAMFEAGYGKSEVLNMLEKPWKWTAEMQIVWDGGKLE